MGGRLAVLLLVAPLALAACGDDSGGGSGASSEPATTQDSTATGQLDAKKLEPTVERVDELGTSKPEVERTRKAKKSKPLPKTGAAKFTGVDRENYKTARFVCGAFPARKVARDLGADSTNPVDIATAYAADYRPAFHEANFEGCLAGLR